jgi:aspartate racemase
MTAVGLVGGLVPESTIDYYRRLIKAWEEVAQGSSPSLVIDSLDAQHGLRLAANDRAGYVAYLLGSPRRLAGAGVDFAVLTANTPHLVDELAAQSPVPLLSIVETCAAEASRRGLTRLGLLGTRFTMEAPSVPRCSRVTRSPSSHPANGIASRSITSMSSSCSAASSSRRRGAS